jgi:hypothetical protein
VKSKLIHKQAGERVFALIFEIGEDPMQDLLEFARQQNLAASHFTGIGAFSEATLAYFDWQRKDYLDIPVREQVEVLVLTGDITLEKREPKVHAHVVLGNRDGSAHGGHLRWARVRPTLEIVLTESSAHLRRRMDPASGLALIDLDASQ